MSERVCGVYVIRCLPTGQIYVGSSVDVFGRWNVHRTALRGRWHPNARLQAAWIRYGEATFRFEVVERRDGTAEQGAAERAWMARLGVLDASRGFNLTAGHGVPWGSTSAARGRAAAGWSSAADRRASTCRPHRLKQRAGRQAQTRKRIAAATMALHQEVGPAQTTISAIAGRAGVERLTVYRHFPTEGELFRACQQHFLGLHPYPDPAMWAVIADPIERLRAALGSLYARNAETEAMTANLLRDAPGMPALAELLQGIPAYLRVATEILARDWNVLPQRRPLLAAAIGHALDFETWRSLVRRQGLSHEQAIDLMVRLVSAVAGARP